MKHILPLLIIFFVFSERAIASSCVKISEICVEGEATKVISGISITKPCWRYRALKRCVVNNYDQDCAELKSNSNCDQTNSVCIATDNAGECSSYRNTFFCRASNQEATNVLQCGSSNYCINDQCDIPQNDFNSDFSKPIATLLALNEAARDNDQNPDNLKIFSGAANNCEKSIGGYNNCCRDDGWGQDYAAASCNEGEKRLIAQQQKKLCHYVGQYCSKKLLGECLKTTKTYCCFNSKLSRIITEQGRQQLGIGWGSPEGPQCRGFTSEELQKLRFDQMNLSEITADLVGSITMPDAEYVRNKVQKTVEGYGQESN